MSTTPTPSEAAADRPDPIAIDRLQPYRQPMVTGSGTGIFVGFAGSFVKADSAPPDGIGATSAIGGALLDMVSNSMSE